MEDSNGNSGTGAAPALAAALDQLWIRFLPEILKRVETLEAAAAAGVARELPPPLRADAHAAAHKLAGALGTFNLAKGTELARELEVLLEDEAGPDCSRGERLTAMAAELRRIVESRE